MAIGRPPFFEEETLTLTGDQTLVLKDANTLLVTASGTNRNLTLPTADAAFWATGAEAKITNVGTSNNVVIKNSDATTLDTLEPGEYGRYYASNGTWHIGDSSNTATGTTDTNAIHDNVASEISALTDVEPAYGDFVLIEDASDSNNKKRVGGDRLIHANIKMPTAADDTGATDAQSALSTFFGTLSDGDIVKFTPGGFYRWGTDAEIDLTTLDNIEIDGQNCTIFFDAEHVNFSIFRVNENSNMWIRGFNVFGYKSDTDNGSAMDQTWGGSPTTNGTGVELNAQNEMVVTASQANFDNVVGRIFETTNNRPQIRWDFSLSDSNQVANDCTYQIINVFPQDGARTGDGTSTTKLEASDAHFMRDLPEVKQAWSTGGSTYSYYVRNQRTEEEALITDFTSDTEITHASMTAWQAGDAYEIFSVLATATTTLTGTPTTYTLRADLDTLTQGWAKGRVLKATGTANTITVASETKYGEQVFATGSDQVHFVEMHPGASEGDDEGTVSRFRMSDCWVENMLGDAFTTSRRSTDYGLLERVTSRVSSRMGISINLGHDWVLDDCVVIGAGRSNYDFETVNSASTLKRIFVRNCRSYQARNADINLAGAGEKVGFFFDNFYSAFTFGSAGGISISADARNVNFSDNCHFEGGYSRSSSVMAYDRGFTGGYYRDGVNITGNENLISPSIRVEYQSEEAGFKLTGNDNRVPMLPWIRVVDDATIGAANINPNIAYIRDDNQTTYVGPFDTSIMEKLYPTNWPNAMMSQAHFPYPLEGLKMHTASIRNTHGISENDSETSLLGRGRVAIGNGTTTTTVTFPTTSVDQPSSLSLDGNVATGTLSETTYYYKVIAGTKYGPIGESGSLASSSITIAAGESSTDIIIGGAGALAGELPMYYTFFRGTTDNVWTHRVDIGPVFDDGEMIFPTFNNQQMRFWDQGGTLYGVDDPAFQAPTSGSANKMAGYKNAAWVTLGASVGSGTANPIVDETGAMPDGLFVVQLSPSWAPTTAPFVDPDADYTISTGGSSKVTGFVINHLNPASTTKTIGWNVFGVPDA